MLIGFNWLSSPVRSSDRLRWNSCGFRANRARVINLMRMNKMVMNCTRRGGGRSVVCHLFKNCRVPWHPDKGRGGVGPFDKLSASMSHSWNGGEKMYTQIWWNRPRNMQTLYMNRFVTTGHVRADPSLQVIPFPMQSPLTVREQSIAFTGSETPKSHHVMKEYWCVEIKLDRFSNSFQSLRHVTWSKQTIEFLDVIHRPVFTQNTQSFGDCILSPSSCIDWAQFDRLQLKTETESSLRNVVCCSNVCLRDSYEYLWELLLFLNH
jgi:hypothetical protein